MLIDDQFAGLTNRLQQFAIPMAGFTGDTFTTIMMDVHDGRMALLEHQQSVNDRDRSIDATITNIRSQYGAEVAQARTEAQESAAAAWASHSNAERYAQMTAAIGVTAANELQERDLTIGKLTCEYQTLTEMNRNCERTALHAYHELKERDVQSEEVLDRTQSRMIQYRSEFEIAARQATEYKAASDTHRELQACIPHAQRRYEHM